MASKCVALIYSGWMSYGKPKPEAGPDALFLQGQVYIALPEASDMPAHEVFRGVIGGTFDCRSIFTLKSKL
jgi:hypothetical protein